MVALFKMGVVDGLEHQQTGKNQKVSSSNVIAEVAVASFVTFFNVIAEVAVASFVTFFHYLVWGSC